MYTNFSAVPSRNAAARNADIAAKLSVSENGSTADKEGKYFNLEDYDY